MHPSIAITPRGTLTVIYGHVYHRDLRILHSTDRGETWSTPRPYPRTQGKTFYPGSLATLQDGRLLHTWNRWATDLNQEEPRSVVYALSNDDGHIWGPTRTFPRPATKRSVIRHPIAETATNQWLTSLTDRTMLYNPIDQSAQALADDRIHGIVPLVITPAGTWVSGAGLRSTDQGASWQTIPGFPNLKEQGWRHELICLENGWLLASEILGPGFGGERIRYVISRDDGLTWNDHYEYYDPGRPIGGQACPRTIQLDATTLGVVFYDMSSEQTDGPGVFSSGFH